MRMRDEDVDEDARYYLLLTMKIEHFWSVYHENLEMIGINLNNCWSQFIDQFDSDFYTGAFD